MDVKIRDLIYGVLKNSSNKSYNYFVTFLLVPRSMRVLELEAGDAETDENLVNLFLIILRLLLSFGW